MNEWPWTGMTPEEEIGYGSYGTGYRVTWEGQECAGKRICIPGSEEEKRALLKQLGSEEEVRKYARETAEKLREEVRLLKVLQKNPHIVSILDDAVRETEEGAELFLLMEYLEPFPVYESRHRMDETEVIRLGIDLCSALSACEEEGIIHRDLKPENILVSREGAFKLCDFGEAKKLEETLSTASVAGTFLYMAPEVYHGKKYDKRADLYSLGCLLYRERNKGKEAFLPAEQRIVTGQEREEALSRRMNGEAFPPPAEASEELTEILLKACSYYPEKRYPDAKAFQEDLLRLQKGSYRLRGGKGRRNGKRGATDYIKIAAGFLLGLSVLTASFLFGRYEYRERFVNECDPEIIRQLEEEYGCTLSVRLSGNGTLYLDRMEDLYCLREDGSYAWIHSKDRIRRIVFGEAVTGELPEQEPIFGSVYFPRESTASTVFPQQELGYLSKDEFQYLENLEEITIQSGSFRFPKGMSFLGCRNLRRIKAPEGAEIRLESDAAGLSETPWYQEEEYVLLGSALVKYNGTGETADQIPDFVRLIGPMAFQGNETLKHVLLPEGLLEIDVQAFQDCTGLSEIQLPKGLTRIGSYAFRNCTSLTALTIPEKVSVIENSFLGCSSLSELQVDAANPNFVMKDGALFSGDGTRLLWGSPGIRGSFRIPEQVQSFDPLPFADAENMSELLFPEDLSAAVPQDLFGFCPSLTRIELPEGIAVSFVLEDSLLFTKDQVQLLFCLRNAAGKVTVPEGVRVISDYAFAFCREMESVSLPESLGYVMSYAFSECTGLTEIRLPASVSLIATHAFSGCSGLKDLYYGGSREEWERMVERFDTGIDESVTTLHF